MVGRLVSNGQGGIWKEVHPAKCNVPSCYLSRGTDHLSTALCE